LVKGKKIYRIFTSGRLKNLQNNLKYDKDLLELIESKPTDNTKKQIEKVEADLKQAMDLILRAMDTLEQIK